MRVCIEQGCPNLTRMTRCAVHERQRQRARNARPERVALYGGGWPAESRAIRAAQPWCTAEGWHAGGLTVDHPTRAVLCRHHHGQLEAKRRGQVES